MQNKSKTHKRCGYCQKSLPRDDFYRAESSKDGLQSHCKYCRALMRKAERGDEAAIRKLMNMPSHKRKHRTPSIGCRSTCPICGMGIDDCLDAGGCYDRP